MTYWLKSIQKENQNLIPDLGQIQTSRQKGSHTRMPDQFSKELEMENFNGGAKLSRGYASVFKVQNNYN